MSPRFQYSFIVDEHPVFAYQGWHLAKSLLHHCAAAPSDIHVQFTRAVGDEVIEIFRAEGYSTHRIEPFGDAKWCNKLSQLPNLFEADADCFVLLDTDTIAVADLRPFLGGERIQGKIVDCANPPLATLLQLYEMAGGKDKPLLTEAEADGEPTFVGNANGGFYAVPASWARRFSQEWRRWAQWLRAHPEPLLPGGKICHIDQISVAFAVQMSGVPFAAAPSNVNYFLHFRGEHRCFDASRPIALLHYHQSLNVVGHLQPPFELNHAEAVAVGEANRLISKNFQNTVFWSFRYAVHPERGSGIGSRGENLAYKRRLLRDNGVEQARSVLDVGCGDLEVLRAFEFQDYLGLDVSQEALKKARAARPDWRFALWRGESFEPREIVLCFEVLIHQSRREDYDRLIAFLARHAEKTLLVSGYDRKDKPYHMVHFHEPLSESLARTGRFNAIRPIGAHTDVTIYRCDVSG